MRRVICVILFLIVIISCKKPYNPPATTAPGSYLVVEGVINSGSDSTFIKLTRTVNISSDSVQAEPNALVTVESDQNAVYSLKETTAGTYAIAALNLDVTRKYRLRIKTANNEEYLSDTVSVKPTPPIDSIGFNITNTGVQIYANTHNANNNTRYYRWDYTETWQFHAKYNSSYQVVYRPLPAGDTLEGRPSTQQIYYCFANDNSSDIILASSAKLAQDVIFQYPITNIPSNSEKIEQKYSILLRQYALTPDAYDFWTNLRKNTEQLGSIFDAQPSQTSGNIHCISNPAKPVIGYISATNVQTKRVFIAYTQLPSSFTATYPYDCEEDSTYFLNPRTNNPDVEYDLFDAPKGTEEPVSQAYDKKGILFYFRSDAECADCTIRGVTKQPAFWQ